MGFSIDPKDGPSILSSQAKPVLSHRERAIAKFMGQNPDAPPAPPVQTAPVQNASQVAPEELSAIQAPTQSVQPDTNVEAPASPAQPSEAEAKKSEEPLSSQYAVLARKEKALRAQMQKFQAEQKSFREEQERLKAQVQPQKPNQSEELEARLKADPLGVLNEMGYTWDQLTQQALNQPSPDIIEAKRTMQALQAEIKALKDAQENARKSQEEQQTTAYKQAVQQLKVETKYLVQNDPSFETIKETGSYDDVVDLIERTFKEDGRLMSVEEAAQAVEDYLVEEALKLAKLKKIQERIKPVAPAETKSQPVPAQQQPMKTLTNDVSAARKLSARERAVLAFEGKLK